VNASAVAQFPGTALMLMINATHTASPTGLQSCH